MNAKVAAIADAQHRCTVTSALPVGLILALVLGLANRWNRPSEDLRSFATHDDLYRLQSTMSICYLGIRLTSPPRHR